MSEENIHLVEFEIPDFREITEDGQRLLLEYQVKANGVWRIHKNDPDVSFPSDFHADRIDQPEKLDLYTGVVYDKRTKQALRKMPRKAMRYIHNELASSKEPEIRVKLADRRRFIYLD